MAPAGTSLRDAPETITARRRLTWIVYSFAPSSLMLGVTMYISTDIAAVPLLWILPLAIYLLTFVFAFARRFVVPRAWVVGLFPLLLLPVVVNMTFQVPKSVWLSVPIHLLGLLAVGWMCHAELAHDRPAPEHLTEFFLWLSVGGVLGGLFNSMVAPHVFSTVAEYPVVLAVACLLRPTFGPAGTSRYRVLRWLEWRDRLPVFLAVPALIVAGMFLGRRLNVASLGLKELRFILEWSVVLVIVWFGLSARRRIVFGVLGAGFFVYLAAQPFLFPSGKALFAARSFYGVYRVVEDPDDGSHSLEHGTTLHGRQNAAPAPACEPTSYYDPTGPVGDLFDYLPRPNRVAVIGLGAGSLACYGEAGERWTFYEIDPVIERIARDPRLFTFLQRSTADIGVVLGDARMSLQSAPPGRYDMMLFDAFSSDAIPVHLTTLDAFRMYLSKLGPNGVLAFHISNRYLDLEPALAVVAKGARLRAAIRDDDDVSDEEEALGKSASTWVAMSRSGEPIDRLLDEAGWRTLVARDDLKRWTDDFSNLLTLLRR